MKLASIAAALALASACHQTPQPEGPFESAGKGLDTATVKTGHALKTAAEKTGTGVEKAAHATGKAFEKVGSKLEGGGPPASATQTSAPSAPAPEKKAD